MTTSEIIWVKNNWEIHTSVPKCSSEVDLFSGVFRNTKPYSLPQYFMVRKVLGSMGRGQLLWRVTLKGPGPTLTPGLIWRQTWETWWLHLRLEFTIGNAAFVTGTRRTVFAFDDIFRMVWKNLDVFIRKSIKPKQMVSCCFASFFIGSLVIHHPSFSPWTQQ